MGNEQLTLMVAVLSMSRRKKVSGAVRRLEEIGKMVDWEGLAEIVSGLDRTRGRKGGRPPISFKVKLKMMFLQYTFNLSDEELEDQLIDRLSFQQFVGLGYDEEIPDLTTFWHFKEGLVRNALMDQVFESILGQIESRGLILKRGTIVDATIMPSGNRPLSNQKRKKLESEPSRQIDTDARSTAKGGKKHFGYKGHIGIDAGSKVIRKRTFTPAHVNDIREMHKLLSGDEKSVFGDKNYRKRTDKIAARSMGIYYGVLDQRSRGKQLSKKTTETQQAEVKSKSGGRTPICVHERKTKSRGAAG